MARVNFREVQSRFTHIDARFVASYCSFPENSARYEVDIYPWWEHPLFVEAQRNGERWGFNHVPEEAHKRVIVHAVNVHEAKFSRQYDVTNWWFTQSDPLLWPYDDASEIICNQPVKMDTWLQILEQVRVELKLPDTTAIMENVPTERVRSFGGSSSFSLGRLSTTLFFPVLAQLQSRGIETFVSREPKKKEVPVLFVADGDDYIIADDFEVELPEFEHKDEWFRV